MNPRPWPREIGHIRQDAVCSLQDADARLIECRDSIHRNPLIAMTALYEAIIALQDTQMLMDNAASYTPADTGRWPQTALEAREHTRHDLDDLIHDAQVIAKHLRGNTDMAQVEIARCRSRIRTAVRRLETVT